MFKIKMKIWLIARIYAFVVGYPICSAEVSFKMTLASMTNMFCLLVEV